MVIGSVDASKEKCLSASRVKSVAVVVLKRKCLQFDSSSTISCSVSDIDLYSRLVNHVPSFLSSLDIEVGGEPEVSLLVASHESAQVVDLSLMTVD